jgi:hypothetical protein
VVGAQRSANNSTTSIESEEIELARLDQYASKGVEGSCPLRAGAASMSHAMPVDSWRRGARISSIWRGVMASARRGHTDAPPQVCPHDRTPLQRANQAFLAQQSSYTDSVSVAGVSRLSERGRLGVCSAAGIVF